MKLTRAQREQIKMKYDGLCAYCGHPLPGRWHVDHLIAVERISWGANKGLMENPHNDTLENMMPACPPCNRSKSKMSIEEWRGWLTGHMQSLNNHTPIYRLMKAYGCVIETGNPVIFHFEKEVIR